MKIVTPLCTIFGVTAVLILSNLVRVLLVSIPSEPVCTVTTKCSVLLRCIDAVLTLYSTRVFCQQNLCVNRKS